MNLKKIKTLVDNASKGKNSIEEGAVGYQGYGFVFKEIDEIKGKVNFSGSSKICSLGKTKEILKDFERKINVVENISEYSYLNNVMFIGSIKTLVPSLKVGLRYGDLFKSWVFVKTPENRQFAVKVYYGRSGLAVGGWDTTRNYNFTKDERFLSILPEDLKSIINFSPHDLTKDELEAFSEAIEFAIRKIPVSDYHGVYMHDFGNSLMGIKNGKPFMVELGFTPKWNDVNSFVNQRLKLDITINDFKKWKTH